MRIPLFIFFILVSTLALKARDSLIFNTSDIEGARIIEQKYFTGSNLWGHIDGAADLFLEYGFQDLRYYQTEVQGIKLDIEIYRFENPYESLGIFSVKKFGCLDIDSTINPMFCQTKYALSFPVNDYYITIAGSHATPEEQLLEREIADALYDKPQSKGLTMKDIYPQESGDFTFNDYKIIMGPLGFQNGLPDWSYRFGDYSGYVCIYYSVGYQNQDIDVFLFNFKIPSQLNRMLKENGWKLDNNEYTSKGETNWLISRRGDMLMLLRGNVPLEILEKLKKME